MPAKTGNKGTPQGAHAMRDSPELLPDPFKRSTRIQRSPEQLGGKTTQERSQSSAPTLQDKSLMIKKSENSFVEYQPNLAEHTSPIHNVINTAIKSKDKTLLWDDNAIKSFEHIKDAFASEVLLNCFNNEADLSLPVEASNTVNKYPQLNQCKSRIQKIHMSTQRKGNIPRSIY
uniref:Reverse transcriptase/retrotransposon-derived protein RNase H-like domain-containing protein n=1 Tax=Glossina pallidipes TaxID=7398 RepID=A0A1B0ACG9_GLOPL